MTVPEVWGVTSPEVRDDVEHPIARVMVDSPVPALDRLFDYAIPQALRDQVVPGIRVRVPLRSAGRLTDAYVVDVVPQGDYSGVLSEIESVVSPVPVLAAEVATLARTAADRAAGSAIDIVRVAVPTRQARVEKAWIAAASTEQVGNESAGRESTSSTEPSNTEPAGTAAEIASNPVGGYADDSLRELLTSGGRAAVDAVPRVTELPDGSWVGEWATAMAQLAVAALAQGGSAILAVPDYRDQDQLMAALGAILPANRLVRLDARQPNPRRYEAFLRCLGTQPLVIVGNRSVIYAPAARLALIAVWDDGDPLHSEPLAPYVHTRDAALLRQQQQGSALLFFGHTRSTEVQRLVEIGWLGSVSPVPAIHPRVIPTAQQTSTDRLAAQARIPSTAWREARAALELGPVLIQVARPGYSPRMACMDCGQSARCLRCEGPLGTRSPGATPACGWCGALAVNWHCENCESTRLGSVGAAGATRTADDLGRAFPGVRVIVADGERPIQHVDATPALVIATRGAEPIASGGYRAVLLLDGEQMVARESLRVAENCLRWWSNAAALAARGAPIILVGVGGAIASAMATWRQADHAHTELVDRRRLRFPPAVRVATVTGSLETTTAAIRALDLPAADILGPVDVEAGRVRTIVRFDYSAGPAVAATLRAEIIHAAAAKRRGKPAPGVRSPSPAATSVPFRVRFDDVEPFD